MIDKRLCELYCDGHRGRYLDKQGFDNILSKPNMRDQLPGHFVPFVLHIVPVVLQGSELKRNLTFASICNPLENNRSIETEETRCVSSERQGIVGHDVRDPEAHAIRRSPCIGVFFFYLCVCTLFLL